VTVASKSNEDQDQYILQNTAVNDFRIAKNPRGNTLGRGTQITLHLKEDTYKFLKENNLKELVHKYTQFITFPIIILSAEEQEVAVEEREHDDELIIRKTEKRIIYGWHHVNPIWMRDLNEITDVEHKEFFKSITKESQDPLSWIQFKGEGGEVNFAHYYISHQPSLMYFTTI
jgi:heat shock protein beta